MVVLISLGTVPTPPVEEEPESEKVKTESAEQAEGTATSSSATAASVSADGADADSGDAEKSLLECLKQDCNETLAEFREKGAVNAVKDAALDVATIVKSTASNAVEGARTLVAESRSGGETLEAADNPFAEDAVLHKDAVFHRLYTEDAAASSSQSVTEEGAASEGEARSSESRGTAPATVTENVNLLDLPLFDTIKHEWNSTVQDIREKGALGAVKDAALDAKDLIGNTAKVAVDGAKSLFNETGATQGDNGEESQQADAAARPPPPALP
jgi:hypothetical protein